MNNETKRTNLALPESRRIKLNRYSIIIPDGFSYKTNFEDRGFWAWLPDVNRPDDYIEGHVLLLEGLFMPLSDSQRNDIDGWIQSSIQGMQTISQFTGIPVGETREFQYNNIRGFVAETEKTNYIASFMLADGAQQVRVQVNSNDQEFKGSYPWDLLEQVLRSVKIEEKSTTESELTNHDTQTAPEKAFGQALQLEKEAKGFRKDWAHQWQNAIDEHKLEMSGKTYMSMEEVETDMRRIVLKRDQFAEKYNKLIYQTDENGKKLLDQGADYRATKVVCKIISDTIQDSHDMDLDFNMAGTSNAHIGEAEFRVSERSQQIAQFWEKESVQMSSSTYIPKETTIQDERKEVAMNEGKGALNNTKNQKEKPEALSKRKSKRGWLSALLVLILACACFFALYKKPTSSAPDYVLEGNSIKATALQDNRVGFSTCPIEYRIRPKNGEFGAWQQDGSFTQLREDEYILQTCVINGQGKRYVSDETDVHMYNGKLTIINGMTVATESGGLYTLPLYEFKQETTSYERCPQSGKRAGDNGVIFSDDQKDCPVCGAKGMAKHDNKTRQEYKTWNGTTVYGNVYVFQEHNRKVNKSTYHYSSSRITQYGSQAAVYYINESCLSELYEAAIKKLNNGDYESATELLQLLESYGYESAGQQINEAMAEKVRDELKKTNPEIDFFLEIPKTVYESNPQLSYDTGIAVFNNQRYEDAKEFFKLSDGYELSDSYLAAIEVLRAENMSLNEAIKLLDGKTEIMEEAYNVYLYLLDCQTGMYQCYEKEYRGTGKTEPQEGYLKFDFSLKNGIAYWQPKGLPFKMEEGQVLLLPETDEYDFVVVTSSSNGEAKYYFTKEKLRADIKGYTVIFNYKKMPDEEFHDLSTNEEAKEEIEAAYEELMHLAIKDDKTISRAEELFSIIPDDYLDIKTYKQTFDFYKPYVGEYTADGYSVKKRFRITFVKVANKWTAIFGDVSETPGIFEYPNLNYKAERNSNNYKVYNIVNSKQITITSVNNGKTTYSTYRK